MEIGDTGQLKKLSNESNASYIQLLQVAFNGELERLIQGGGNMFKLRCKVVELIRNPISGRNVNVESTFDYLSERYFFRLNSCFYNDIK